MTEELKQAALEACPFCGADPQDAHHIEYGRWAVTCRCGAKGASANTGPNATDAAKIKAYSDARTAWNTRALTQRPAAQAGERVAFEVQATLESIIKQYRIKAADAHWLRASLPTQPVALRSVHLTRDTAGMCVVRINGRVAIRDNGDIIDHMATLEWFADTQQATPEPVGEAVAWWYGTHPRPSIETIRLDHTFTDHAGEYLKGRPLVFGDTRPAPGVPEGWALAQKLPTAGWSNARGKQEALVYLNDVLAAAQAKGGDHG